MLDWNATMQPLFEREQQHFEAHRDQWVARGDVDRWVAIRGDQVVGFWDSLGEAVEAVQKQFGDEAVYIRQVTFEDDAIVIHRLGS
jgi:hypothetical protein